MLVILGILKITPYVAVKMASECCSCLYGGLDNASHPSHEIISVICCFLPRNISLGPPVSSRRTVGLPDEVSTLPLLNVWRYASLLHFLSGVLGLMRNPNRLFVTFTACGMNK